MIVRLSILLASIFIAGCGDEPTPTPQAPQRQTIKATDFTGQWPLIAPEATLGCEPPSSAYIEIAGRRCALNGAGLSAGFERCDDAAKTGNAVAFSVFIEKALGLCPGRE